MNLANRPFSNGIQVKLAHPLEWMTHMQPQCQTDAVIRHHRAFRSLQGQMSRLQHPLRQTMLVHHLRSWGVPLGWVRYIQPLIQQGLDVVIARIRNWRERL